MKPQALIGALIGGVIGAVIWGVIAHLTGYEHSLIAIGVGALVGFGAKALGGEGAATGLFAVVITVGAIFAGKMFAVYLVLNASLDEINGDVNQVMYEEYMEDARLFNDIRDGNEQQWREFMIDRGYSEERYPDDILKQDLEDFRTYTAGPLIEMYEEQPTYDQWKSDVAVASDDLIDASLLSEYAIDNLGFLDILFVIVAVATAFSLASGGNEEA